MGVPLRSTPIPPLDVLPEMMDKKKHIVFDWGDTLMRDDPSQEGPMYLWPTVQVVAGAEEALRTLAKTCTISVATSAAQSDEEMVRRALARVGLDGFVARIFTGRQMGRKKTDSEFWHHIQVELDAKKEEILIVGDSFESDVATPASAGFFAVWFNPTSTEKRNGEHYSTIHDLMELIGKAEPDAALNRLASTFCRKIMNDFDLIAEREYDAVFPDGTPRKIRVGITRPYLDPDSPENYRCDFVIFWPDGSTPIRQGPGVDAMQALWMAMRHWEIETEHMKKILNGKISFLGGSDLL